MGASTGHSLFQRIAAGVQRESKKAAVLTFLVVVLLILWVRMATRAGDGAQRAVAAPVAPSQLVPGRAPSPATAPAGGPAGLREWLSQPVPSPRRNLFVVNLEHFPQETHSLTDGRAESGGFWVELAKSVGEEADLSKERRVLVENLQRQASQLRLQTTLMGPTPKAVINGELVRVGDVVACGPGENRAQFRVLKIEPRRIILEREGIMLEVTMK